MTGDSVCQHCDRPVRFGQTEAGHRGFVHVETGVSTCSPAPADDRPVIASIRLTRFQAEEVQHGLDVDDADGDDDYRPWGTIRSTGRRTAWLDVLPLEVDPGAFAMVTTAS